MELCRAAFVVALFMLATHTVRVVASVYTYYRLPTAIQPDHYELKIITYLDNPANLSFGGQVSIRFHVLEETTNITLHMKNLTIDDSRIQLKGNDSNGEFRLFHKSIETEPDQDYYIIQLYECLCKGQVYNLTLHFLGVLNDESQGYFRSSYVEEATNETRWLAVTHFEPTYARTAFPCFDEPNYKAKFVIWLGHNKSLTALSNMPLQKQIPLGDSKDFVWSILEESVPMSTYLVAYAVHDFAYKESQIEGSDIVFRTWCRRDYIKDCDYAAEVAPKFLQYYEDLFAITFPLKKLDQIAVPDFIERAMENWGLITYTETALMYKPGVSSQLDKEETSKIIAHELAHQWFGNLVTMNWWSDLWLNEGFATYVASLGIEHVTPEWQLYNTEALLNFIYILSEDDILSSHPVSHPVTKTSDINGLFDFESYEKGSAVLRLMHSFLGRDEFFEGVRDYLTKHKYENAEQDDLWAAFTETAHKYNRIKPHHDIKTIMDSWTLQSGYPLLKVSRNNETGSIEISQERFLENSTISGKEVNKCWWVPLSYTTATELDFTTMTSKAWLECDESGKSIHLKLDNVTGANEWLILNIQLSGIYRIMYDDDNWMLLQQALTSDRFTDIHVMNRAQIIDDVMSLAWSDYTTYECVFDILEYLTKEREYLPWKSAAVNFIQLFDLLKHYPQHQSYFTAYMRYIVEPIYFYVGGLNVTFETSTPHLQIALANLVADWACLVGLEHCVQTALDYFRQWKLAKNPEQNNNIPVDLRATVYCTAMIHGDNTDWTFLWQRYKATKLNIDKLNIIQSLACSRNETLLREFLVTVFNKDKQIRKIEAQMAFETLASNEVGLSLALAYFTEHIAELRDGGFNVAILSNALLSAIVSTEDLSKITGVIESNKDYFRKDEDKRRNSIAKINSSIKWIERNLEDMKLQLQRRLSLKGSPQDNVIEQLVKEMIEDIIEVNNLSINNVLVP